MINKYLQAHANKRVKPAIKCKDGFTMSVQVSKDHHCTPRSDNGPYSHVEVGYLAQYEPALIPYAEFKNKPLNNTLFNNVPVAIVNALIAKHGGLQ